MQSLIKYSFSLPEPSRRRSRKILMMLLLLGRSIDTESDTQYILFQLQRALLLIGFLLSLFVLFPVYMSQTYAAPEIQKALFYAHISLSVLGIFVITPYYLLKVISLCDPRTVDFLTTYQDTAADHRRRLTKVRVILVALILFSTSLCFHLVTGFFYPIFNPSGIVGLTVFASFLVFWHMYVIFVGALFALIWLQKQFFQSKNAISTNAKGDTS
jgi:hypothetical protein